MLYRKAQDVIKQHLISNSNKVLVVDGARQIGKSFIIRYIGTSLFKNYIEINLLEDSLKERIFEKVLSVEDFYIRLSTIAGEKMGTKEDTLIFLDEIQEYPHLLTLLKFLQQDERFSYITSGSLLGITLKRSESIPIGSIEILNMYPLDFEEFLIANSFGKMAIESLKKRFMDRMPLEEDIHNKVMDLFRKYLLVGGLPDAVNTFLETKNIYKVRTIQKDIHTLYGTDASKYDTEHRLKIMRIYNMIPSILENKKKRIVIKDIEGKKGKRFSNYEDEFDYLINSGIAIDVNAISTPVFPLIESSGKNLLKLYLNDVGLFTGLLYSTNINAIMDDIPSINLGSVYECVVATELKAHGHPLFYYDNKKNGEVDYIIDDYETLSVLPIEVKSGKDYKEHSALDHFMSDNRYPVKNGIVLSNERNITILGGIIYLPVYFVMFL